MSVGVTKQATPRRHPWVAMVTAEAAVVKVIHKVMIMQAVAERNPNHKL